ncbi:M56 family metallopeptidase [Flavobacterium sp. RSP15]|uniref:M56 family metallopeptidase n=1 Tax=Flavobacterium sp. RSP15 TaxID=2497485 RepID=UPI000F81CF4B|nr:M56 family metallopeptidase [Flavobacterium sp. RSP15]RTY88642.1 M56 family peptidase [Flavobacterium sp. RSP15]
MEVFYIYLIKSSGLIALFYLAYHFMLRKETFFTSNRWFLLLGLFTSILLPLVVFTKTIWVEPTPINYDWSSLPKSTIIDEDHTQEYIFLALAVLYCIGTLCLFTKFGFEFYSLQKIVKGKTIKRQANFKFIDLKDNLAPFSYFNTIVYNSSLYSSSELENILEHEKVHSEQNHTVDVLISRLFCIVFWFNPFIWFYKKAIIQNLEFIADSEATKKISDKKAYQFTLLKITTQENCVAITNHFYQSLIKKRIVMLNKNQSKKSNSWKYAVVIPALVAFVMLFQVNVIAQEKKIKIDEIIEMSKFNTDKSTTDIEIRENCEIVQKTHNVTLIFSNIKRNSLGEIVNISASYDDHKGNKEEYTQEGNTPINRFVFFYKKDKLNNVNIGFFNADLKKKAKKIDVVTDTGKRRASILTIKTKEILKNDSPEKPIIFINGKKTNLVMEVINKMDQNSIKTMTVLKGSAAEEKYGDEGKNGAIEITTKNLKRELKNPIIFINGKRTNTTLDDLNKTDQNLIESMTVLKKINAEEKYGNGGGNGAIEIITKGNVDLLKSSNKKSK